MGIYSVAKKVTFTAGSKTAVTVFTVGPARKFRIQRVLLHFPSGSNFNLGVAVRVGINNVCPEQGLVYGDDCVIELHDDTVVDSGSDINLYGENEDTTADHSVLVVIEGVME